MKKLISTLILLLSQPLQAGVLSPPSLGDNCKELVMTERELGAKIETSQPQRYVLHSNYLGPSATTTFECHQEQLTRATYTFLFKSFEAAKQFFAQQRTELNVRYGRPSIDQGSEAYIKHMQSIGFVLTDEHKHMLIWKNPHSEILFGANRISADKPDSVVSLDIIPGEQHNSMHQHQ